MEFKTEKLVIEPPHELRFVGPFNRNVITQMKLTNPTDQPMLFKIKTTAPKRYCVRPNFGLILPQSSTKVEICLQPFTYDASEKNKHKFMVQSVISPPDGYDDINKVWKDVDPELLVDAKLKCVFEMPNSSSNNESVGVPSSAGVAVVKEPVQQFDADDGNGIKTTAPQKDVFVAELRQLRDENNKLREDNFQLKETLMRQRCSKPDSSILDEPYTPVLHERPIPTFYIAVTIAAAIFGLLLGKYLL